MTRARLRVAATSSFRADPSPPLPCPPPPRTRPEDRPGLPTNTGLWMRAAPGTRRLGPLSSGYIRRPRGWTGRRGGEAKGRGSRPARLYFPARASLYRPGEFAAAPAPEWGNRSPTWTLWALRPPRARPAAFGARAHAPAYSRSPTPGLPAAPLGFRRRRERKEKGSGRSGAVSVAVTGRRPSALAVPLRVAGVTECGGSGRPRKI